MPLKKYSINKILFKNDARLIEDIKMLANFIGGHISKLDEKKINYS